MKAQRLVWALNRLPHFGIQTFKCLQEKNIDLAQCEDSEILNLLAALDPDFPHEFSRILNSSEFESELETCSQANIQIVSILDSDYPKNLAAIYDPPLILYMKGHIIAEDQFSIAIVGSRHPTAYGIRMAAKFSSELSQQGITIISGFARGIDAEAHRSSLRVKGRTLAVFGCGLDIVYPKEHVSLYEQIVENGAIISEFPLGTIPQAFNFPKRNRIITGLSMGVLVVEANHRSGSLITASIAAEEGREVYAIPGQIDSVTAQGTNHLIQNGAKLVISADDILVDLYPQLKATVATDVRHCEETVEDSSPVIASPAGAKQSDTKCHPEAKPKDLQVGILRCAQNDTLASLPRNDINDPTNNSLLKLLTNEPLSLDEIIVSLSGSPNDILSRLAQLEVQGAVKRLLGGKYVRTPDIAIT